MDHREGTCMRGKGKYGYAMVEGGVDGSGVVEGLGYVVAYGYYYFSVFGVVACGAGASVICCCCCPLPEPKVPPFAGANVSCSDYSLAKPKVSRLARFQHHEPQTSCPSAEHDPQPSARSRHPVATTP